MRLFTSFSLCTTLRKTATAAPSTARHPLSLRLAAPVSVSVPHQQQRRKMASSSDDLNIENKNINSSVGVDLSENQKTLVGCVLDLFAGRPTLAKLKLWRDDAVFEDPLTIARGREQYEPQWYGLAKAFSEIERLSHEVTSSGNPITMDMKTRYVIKGIGKEQTINSLINIYVDSQGKIEKVEDKWDGQLPEGGIKDVSTRGVFVTLCNPFWWVKAVEHAVFWAWSFLWETRLWLALRRLNAKTVPQVVGVPKED